MRLGFSTYVALVDADNQARTGSCFLGHFDGWLWVVVDGGDGEKSSVEEILQLQKVLGRVRVGVGVDARPEGGLPDCGEGAANGERVVLALPRGPPPSPLVSNPNP